MIPRISITGTESTGKTTLAEELSQHFGITHIPDVSRSYIASLQRPYNRTNVLNIAEKILEEEDKATQTDSKFLLSDNDLINIKIWLFLPPLVRENRF